MAHPKKPAKAGKKKRTKSASARRKRDRKRRRLKRRYRVSVGLMKPLQRTKKRKARKRRRPAPLTIYAAAPTGRMPPVQSLFEDQYDRALGADDVSGAELEGAVTAFCFGSLDEGSPPDAGERSASDTTRPAGSTYWPFSQR